MWQIPSFAATMCTERLWRLLLDNFCLASEREATSTIPTLSRWSNDMWFQGMSLDSKLSGCNLCWGEVWVRFTWIIHSWIGKETWNSRKFSPAKETHYTIHHWSVLLLKLVDNIILHSKMRNNVFSQANKISRGRYKQQIKAHSYEPKFPYLLN